MTTQIQLGQAKIAALIDCKKFSRGAYIWKQKTMAKLAAMGLVEKIENTGWGNPDLPAWTLTKAGEAALSSQRR